MIFSVLSFFLIFFAHSQTNVGFYNYDSNEIPNLVRESEKKIFKIQLPYFATTQLANYDFFLGKAAVPENGKVALRKCKLSAESECLFEMATINGTGFLDEDPSMLWTNCHIVSPWMSQVSKMKNFEKRVDVYSFYKTQNVPLKLSNRKGELIFDSHGANDQTELIAFSPQKSLEGYDGNCSGLDDLVKIKLNRPLATQGLTWSKKKITASTNLYIGGYPKATHTRSPLGFLDSDGKNFFWAQGSILIRTSSDFSDFLKAYPETSFSLQYSPYVSAFFADSVEGFSGSPVINEQGEIVGIYNSFINLDEDKDSPPLISLFIQTSGMNFIEILSK